jgi:ribosomal protein S18 acetylase RimI-like enzyme
VLRLTYFVRRFKECIGQEGVGATASKVIKEIVDRIHPPWQCLFWMPLSGFEGVPAVDGVSLRVISDRGGDADLSVLERILGSSTVSVFRTRLAQGCQLHILYKEQAVAGTLFFVFGRTQGYQHVVLTERDAAILDARVDPAFRGQGLYPIFLRLSLDSLRGKDIERVFVATSEHNEPSLRALRRVGFRYLMRYKTWMGLYKCDPKPL